MAWRVVKARFAGHCVNCGGQVPRDAEVEWERGSGLRHRPGECLAQPVELPRGRLMNARFRGKCADCGGELKVGDSIDFVRGTGAFHPRGTEDCEPGAMNDEQAEPLEPGETVPNGRYTVMLNGPDDRVYLRVKKWKQVQAVSVQPVGPEADMTNDRGGKWVGFGTFRGRELQLWRRMDGSVSDRVLLAVEQLAQPDAWQEYGEAYAVEFGKCFRCGATLKVPASLTRGTGPECAKMLGLQYPSKEEIAEFMAEHQVGA